MAGYLTLEYSLIEKLKDNQKRFLEKLLMKEKSKEKDVISKKRIKRNYSGPTE